MAETTIINSSKYTLTDIRLISANSIGINHLFFISNPEYTPNPTDANGLMIGSKNKNVVNTVSVFEYKSIRNGNKIKGRSINIKTIIRLTIKKEHINFFISPTPPTYINLCDYSTKAAKKQYREHIMLSVLLEKGRIIIKEKM